MKFLNSLVRVFYVTVGALMPHRGLSCSKLFNFSNFETNVAPPSRFSNRQCTNHEHENHRGRHFHSPGSHETDRRALAPLSSLRSANRIDPDKNKTCGRWTTGTLRRETIQLETTLLLI